MRGRGADRFLACRPLVRGVDGAGEAENGDGALAMVAARGRRVDFRERPVVSEKPGFLTCGGSIPKFTLFGAVGVFRQPRNARNNRHCRRQCSIWVEGSLADLYMRRALDLHGLGRRHVPGARVGSAGGDRRVPG
jgi:hypothetical protein